MPSDCYSDVCRFEACWRRFYTILRFFRERCFFSGYCPIGLQNHWSNKEQVLLRMWEYPEELENNSTFL